MPTEDTGGKEVHPPQQRGNAPKEHTPQNGRFSASGIVAALPGLADFLRAAAVVAIVIFVYLKWSFLSDWLGTIYHFEGFGTQSLTGPLHTKAWIRSSRSRR
jgi:hypothetical protein